jgi:hypothetical protein
MVEAPGTAPGSEWLITKAVYRRSRLAPTRLNIGRFGGEKKVDALITPSLRLANHLRRDVFLSGKEGR